MQNRFGRSELELRELRNSLEIGPRSSRGVRSAPLFAQMPNPPLVQASGRAGGASRGGGSWGAVAPPGKTLNDQPALLTRSGGGASPPRGRLEMINLLCLL
eukprot:3104255-Alexandrium_andersonii.AAC.1